jgi:UDP-N-acetylglucosamine--N-acetylmuramyl-(pentapeptide) pyrophosphoryl-undecaprenol N-acetylglucosamine transferase
MKGKILFVGGGTGGHIAPIVPVMQAVHELYGAEVEIGYAGLASDLTSPLLEEAKVPIQKMAVRAGKLHRHLTWNHFRQLGQFLGGFRDAARLLRTFSPNVLFAKGGYVTLPLVMVARWRKIPIVGHESDAVPGLANRIIARMADYMCTSFPPETYTAWFPLAKTVFTGQPVRTAFREAQPRPTQVGRKVIPADLPIVTVVGGSQGARRVNELISACWERLAEEAVIVHATGAAEHAEYQALAKKLPLAIQQRLVLSPFITAELPALLQKSAVVVSRSGGMVAELAAARACVILIPLSTSAQNHQWANAEVLAQAGAAATLDEREATPDRLSRQIRELLTPSNTSTTMRAAIYHFDRPNAATDMANLLGRFLPKA